MTAVGIRCDAGPTTGVGHLVRCVALAEELRSRGVAVHFLADLGGLAWARRQLAARGLPCHRPPTGPGELATACATLRLDAVVLDSYELPPGYGRQVRAAGRTVLAVVDGDPRGMCADMYLDQNLDAELSGLALLPGTVHLAGLRYVLLRDAVRCRRPAAPPDAGGTGRVPRVVCFFGGTDPFRAAPAAIRLLVATGATFDAVVVGASAAVRAELTAVEPGPGQTITVLPPTDDLPALLAGADLAVSASGTSTWELLCLGVPSALVWVVDNQRLGYHRAVARRLVAGLGRLADLNDGQPPARRATAVLRDLLTDPARRAELARRAWSVVDGRGRERVADALLRHVAERAAARDR